MTQRWKIRRSHGYNRDWMTGNTISQAASGTVVYKVFLLLCPRAVQCVCLCFICLWSRVTVTVNNSYICECVWVRRVLLPSSFQRWSLCLHAEQSVHNARKWAGRELGHTLPLSFMFSCMWVSGGCKQHRRYNSCLSAAAAAAHTSSLKRRRRHRNAVCVTSSSRFVRKPTVILQCER